jgi:5-methyltetrahydropteroyltriglutamate--homocysteine methyltransferase
VQVRDAEFLLAHTHRTTKMTVPGPFTMSQQAQDDHYGSPEKVGMAYAAAVREEILDLIASGIDIVQVDEPYMQARPDAAREYGLDVLMAATDGIDGTIAVHICFGYAAIIHDRPSGYSFLPELAATECAQVSIETAQSGLELDVLESLPQKTIILGVLDLSTDEVETPETVADRIARAFPHADATRLIAAPDCGMKYLSREAAYGKLEALVEGARLAAQDGAPRSA